MARRRWSRPQPNTARSIAAPKPSASTPVDQMRRLTCALCGREEKGFGYIHKLRQGECPNYRFCSMGCCQSGGTLAQRSGGVIDRTPMEARAVKDARRWFAEVLTELGLMGAFHDRSAAEIDRIIEACIDGFQDSMRRQATEFGPFADPIPF